MGFRINKFKILEIKYYFSGFSALYMSIWLSNKEILEDFLEMPNHPTFQNSQGIVNKYLLRQCDVCNKLQISVILYCFTHIKGYWSQYKDLLQNALKILKICINHDKLDMLLEALFKHYSSIILPLKELITFE